MKVIDSDFSTIESPIPVPQANEALVRVHSFGVTFGDLRFKDLVPMRKLGVEFSGTIDSFGGKDQTGFRTGQSVYGLAICGGAFAEYVVCPLDTLCPIPKGISFTAAAGIADAWFSALQLLKHDAEMKKRDKVLVFNAMSPNGQSTVELAQILGCRRIFAVVYSDEAVQAIEQKLKFKTALPDEVVPLIDSATVERDVRKYGSTGVAAVIDLRTRPNLSQGLNLLKEDGRAAVASVPLALTERDLTNIVYKRIRLHGVTFRARPPVFYREYRDFIVNHLNPKFQNGQLKIRLARVYNWKDISKAFTYVAENREAPGKVICNIVRD